MYDNTSTTNPTEIHSTEKTKFVLARLTSVLWCFVCLFGALAAMGFLTKTLRYPNWELYFQLGFIGEAAALILMGALQLGQAVTLQESILQRLMRVAGFFLGIGGALLTLGTFFTLLKYPNAGMFMQLGLTWTAAALAAIGLLKLGEAMTMEAPHENESGGSGDGI